MSRKGVWSTIYNWNGERSGRWKKLIQSEEDPRWYLVTDGKHYGLNHKCSKTMESISDNPAGTRRKLQGKGPHGCAYCHSPAPDGLMTVLILYEYGCRGEQTS